MKKPSELTHPYLILIEELKCPTPGCEHVHTREFNLLRIATFNIAQRQYNEIKRKVEGVRPISIEQKNFEAFKKYTAGEITEKFDFKCRFCKKRHEFKVNALTGDVTNAAEEVILHTPMEQIPHCSELAHFNK